MCSKCFMLKPVERVSSKLAGLARSEKNIARKSSCSSVIPSGTFTGSTSAYGTTGAA
jgi:hypothetical protein